MRALQIYSAIACSAFVASSAIGQPGSVPQSQWLSGSHSQFNPDQSGYRHKAYEDYKVENIQEVCCPGGYPWYRESTNTCFGSYEDCHNTNGGGWSCRQVNAC